MRLFGRITANPELCKEICKGFCKTSSLLIVHELGSKNEAEHCHFIGVTEKDYKTERSCRDAFSRLCFKITNKKKNYSVKEFEDHKEEECLRYLLKDVDGHKAYCVDYAAKGCSCRCPSNVIFNGLCIYPEDLQKYHRDYWAEFNKLKKPKDEKKAFWEKIYDYILEKDGSVFDKCDSKTPRKIGNYVYDYFEENQKFLQNDRFIELVIKTIMIKAYTNHSDLRERLKRSMVDNWINNFSQLNYFEFEADEEIEEDL